MHNRYVVLMVCLHRREAKLVSNEAMGSQVVRTPVAPTWSGQLLDPVSIRGSVRRVRARRRQRRERHGRAKRRVRVSPVSVRARRMAGFPRPATAHRRDGQRVLIGRAVAMRVLGGRSRCPGVSSPRFSLAARWPTESLTTATNPPGARLDPLFACRRLGRLPA